jgi:hypothetical protein
MQQFRRRAVKSRGNEQTFNVPLSCGQVRAVRCMVVASTRLARFGMPLHELMNYWSLALAHSIFQLSFVLNFH